MLGAVQVDFCEHRLNGLDGEPDASHLSCLAAVEQQADFLDVHPLG